MESFTVELNSNAAAKLFADNKLSSFTDFLPEQLNLECQWEVAISGISYQSMNQNVSEGKLGYLMKTFSKSSDFYPLQPGLYPSITDIDETMNTLNQEIHKHSESCITVKGS